MIIGVSTHAASITNEAGVSAGDSGLFPRKIEITEAAPEAVLRIKLVEILARHTGVQEYVLFDPTGFLEDRNEGVCRLEDFDPVPFLQQIDSYLGMVYQHRSEAEH